MSDNLTPIKQQLDCGADVIWAVPTGGYGHVADEQPFPYIRFKGNDLTPRFGGDESITEAGYDSLPLPSGIISGKWPFKQILFNIFRRRVNIYWRNIFCSFNKNSPNFLFAQQLNYKKIENGFIGESPIVYFRREFIVKADTISVKDYIAFKDNLNFNTFSYAHIAIFPEEKINITSKATMNTFKQCLSSTGSFLLNCKQVKSTSFKKGDVLTNTVIYRLLNEL